MKNQNVIRVHSRPFAAKLGFFLLLCGLLPAQERAQFGGVIRDSSNAVVSGASITAVNEDTGFRRAVLSRLDGGYDIVSLQPGFYKMTVRMDGFRTLVQFGVKLDVAQSARVDFMLQVGSVHEVVTVESNPFLLNSDDASVSTLVGREWIEHLPLNGRGLLSLLELAPGSLITPAASGEAGQFSVGGQRPNTNYFTVDGVSANNGVGGGGSPAQLSGGSLPNMTAFGGLYSLVSLEVLSEFRIQTSTLSPEYGASPGGQVALSTRSGSNDFHGSIFDAVRNEALDANDWFANRNGDPRAPFRLQDFGATLGGPLRRNRTFFFLSYEGLRMRQPFTFLIPVPSVQARSTAATLLQPALNLFPLPNGPDLGGGLAEYTESSAQPSRLDAGSVRIDHAFSPRFVLFARYHQAPSTTEFNYVTVNDFTLGWKSLTLGLNAIVSPAFLNEFRVNASRSTGDSVWQHAGEGPPPCYVDALLFTGSAPCESFFRVSIGGLGQLLAGADSSNRQGQWNLVETASLSKGSHQIRLGADYLRLTPQRNSPPTSVNIAAASLTDFLNQSFAVTITQAQQAATVLDELSLFAQDTWRVSSRLTLTYGLRWQLSPSPRVPVPPLHSILPASASDAPTIPIWQTRYDDFAPRLGAAYRLSSSGKTVLRAGLGIYYDPGFGVATDGVNGAPYNSWQFHSATPGPGRPIPPPTLLTYAFAPDLRLPLIWEWNAAVEHAFTGRDVFSAGYVGSAGRHLLRREVGVGSSALAQISIATNHGSSDYDALQMQYRRRVVRGLQSILSYSWSHSIDTGSSDSSVFFMLRGWTAAQDRGSSDFDARHVFTAAFSYELPYTKGWQLDGIFRVRTGFPVDILDAETALGVSYANLFRPNLVSGQPVWLVDPSAPGGERLNPAAFQAAGSQGNLGRNTITGLGMSQLDVAVRRSFALSERYFLDLRIEAFNALNQANLADPVRFLVSPLFGQSTSMLNLMLGNGSPGTGLTPALQVGGARSLQAVVRFRF